MDPIPNIEDLNFAKLPEPNMFIQFGSNPGFVIPIRVEKTIVARLKWWVFSWIFPVSYEWIKKVKKEDD